MAETFGFTGEGWMVASIENGIRGGFSTCTLGGTAEKITVFLNNTSVAKKMKCALYKKSDNSLVGETIEVEIPTCGNSWHDFLFEDPKPSLDAGTDYWICVWSEQADGQASIIFEWPATYEHTFLDSHTYNGWPQPLVPDPSAYDACIYCTYTPGPEDYPVGRLKKGFVSGFHCFVHAYINALLGGYNPLKLPDGTTF